MIVLHQHSKKAWDEHKETWLKCNHCPLHESRGVRDTVLYRGYIPCDILFIGESPAEMDASLGEPFVGSSGKYLDDLIKTATQECRAITRDVPADDINETFKNNDIKLGFTNVIGCHPIVDGQLGPPKKIHITSCFPRLEDIVRIANPKAIVLVGQIPQKNLPNTHSLICIKKITHPSSILRMTKNGQKEIACSSSIHQIKLAISHIQQIRLHRKKALMEGTA